MADPRLNSIHLDARRREEFRQARRNLLADRGDQTLAAESPHPFSSPISSNTIVQNGEPAPSQLQWWLVDEDFIYPLRVGVSTVGRAPDNDVVVRDGYVSRRHCAILVHSTGQCEVYDLASKNGTYLNEVRVERRTALKRGDRVRMCDLTLVFMTKQEDQAEAASPTLTH